MSDPRARWAVATAYAGDDLRDMLALGWEPFAVTIEPEIGERGYQIGDQTVYHLRRGHHGLTGDDHE